MNTFNVYGLNTLIKTDCQSGLNKQDLTTCLRNIPKYKDIQRLKGVEDDVSH